MNRRMIALLVMGLAGLASAQGVDPSAISTSFLDPQAGAARPAGNEEPAYKEATDALNAGDFNRAAARFEQVAAMRGRRADAALYWQAYALNKQRRRNEALQVVARLRKEHPQSKWLNDAGALELEVKQATGNRSANVEATADDELKLLALNSLMQSDPERAIPLVENVLRSNNSPKVKERAMFVLAQSDAPRARQAIGAIARGQSGPALQADAIRFMATNSDGQEHRQTFQEIYAASNDPKVKRAVLEAFMISDDQQGVLHVARSEQNRDLRRQAIHQLGAMDANEELRQMFQSSTAVEDKLDALQALGIAGDANTLGQIARTPGDSKVRIAALRALGIAEGKASRDAAVAVYNSDKDPEVREAAIEALFIQDDAGALIQLARSEKDPQMRRAIVEKLAIMDDKEAKAYMLELLK